MYVWTIEKSLPNDGTSTRSTPITDYSTKQEVSWQWEIVIRKTSHQRS
jgi:hypothetical protein